MASQVDLRIRQLLAMNPDSPLGVSRKGEYQDVELYFLRAGSTYRKTTPVLLLRGFLPVDVEVLFGMSF